MKKLQYHTILNTFLIFSLTATLLLTWSCSSEQPGGDREDQPFVFLFMSDLQADPQKADYSGVGSLLARAVEEGKPELLLLGGDTVNDGADQDEWLAFHEATGTSLTGLTVAAAAGSHDGYALLAEQFTLPSSAPEKPGQGYFYAFSMNGVHFSMLDSNIMGAANPEDVAWLKEALSGAEAKGAHWRIAVCHHPFWPVAEVPKDVARARTMRAHFLPLLEEYKVDLLLVGHQHVYARSLPMRGENPAEAGLIQVMAASGDKPSYTPEPRPYLALTAESTCYVLISATVNELAVTAYDSSGAIIDFFTIKKEE